VADLSDRLFLALAAKAGYPTQPELVRCWGIVQARAREGKPPMTLFQACFTEGVMSVEQAARFSRWAEQVNQRDPGPLEASDSEDAIADWLEDHGCNEGWLLAPTFVAAGLEFRTSAELRPGEIPATSFVECQAGGKEERCRNPREW